MAKGIAHREWRIDGADYDSDAEFRAAVESEMVLNVQIMERLGLGMVVAPIRSLVGGDYVTTGYYFKTATVPGIRDEEPAEELPEVDPEPVEA